MKKIILNTLFSITLIMLCLTGMTANAASWQNTNGPATQYIVQLKRIDLCTDVSCSTSHTLVEKTMSLDIASVSAGQEVGTYAAEVILPPKGVVYTHFRSKVDGTFTIKGYAPSTTSGGAYCYTSSNGTQTALAGGTYTTSATTAAANATAVNLELPSDTSNITVNVNGTTTVGTWSYPSYQDQQGNDFFHTVSLSRPYIYMGEGVPTIDMAFGTQLAVLGTEMGGGDASGDCNLTPGEPVINVTIN